MVAQADDDASGWWKAGFNAGQYTLSVGTAALVLAALSGSPDGGTEDTPAIVVSLITCGVFFLLNTSLPGIAIAFLLTGVRAPAVLVMGAAIAGWLGALLVLTITRRTRVPYDASLGLVLVTERRTGWVLACFWLSLGLAVLAGVQYLFKARREVSS